MNLEELLATLLAEHRTAQTAIDAAVDAATTESRDLTDVEATALTEARAVRDRVDTDITAVEARIAARDRDLESAARAAVLATRVGADVRVGREERVYRPGGATGFFADLYASRMAGDPSAADRLHRHTTQEMEHRDIAVSALAGIVAPQYLVDQFAGLARAGRPFLNSLTSQPLPPEGVSFIVPRGTTGSLGAMTAEAAGWSEQDMVVTDLTSTVNLVTAQQDISRTLFMRGGPLVDGIIFADLAAASEVALNLSALTGSGTAPQHRGVTQVAGISAVAYTDVSPTVGEAWPKLSDAIQRINTLRFMPGQAIYMHPRRWGWVQSAVDTTGRPLFEFSSAAPNVVFGLGDAAAYGQVVGTMQGLPVITDASIPTNLGAGTNEDIVIVARTADFLFYEDSLMQFTFEQTLTTSPGQVRLAAGRFSLFVPGRYPTGISTIGGTGFVPPAF